MPDSTLARGLISTAKRLVPVSQEMPSQANLRRSISTCYYAVFHAMAKSCADGLIGSSKRTRPNKAWVEVYRGLEHGSAKDACVRAKSIDFPPELQTVAENFVQLQNARHRVDYDPMVRPTKTQALFYISVAEQCISALKAVRPIDKKAFATWVLITSRGATDARKRVKDGTDPSSLV